MAEPVATDPMFSPENVKFLEAILAIAEATPPARREIAARLLHAIFLNIDEGAKDQQRAARRPHLAIVT